jgi:hypothetical protein
MESRKPEWKKSLEAITIGGIGGLIVGGIAGISDAVTNSNFGNNEDIIMGISVATGSVTPMGNKSKFVSYILGISSVNVCYRIGYYSFRALYETLK